MSDKHHAAVESLLEVQKGLTTVKNNATNPHFHSNYADLSAVLGAVKEPLNRAGFVIVQKPEPSESLDTIKLTTELIHTSGEIFSCTATAPMEKRGPQAYGSALTYLRRYSLVSLLGLATEDDDANGAERPASDKHPAMGSTPPKATSAQKPNASTTHNKARWGEDGRISEKQGKRLFAIAKSVGMPEDVLKEHLAQHNIEHTYDIHWKKYDEICAWVQEWQSTGGGDDVPAPPGGEDDIPF